METRMTAWVQLYMQQKLHNLEIVHWCCAISRLACSVWIQCSLKIVQITRLSGTYTHTCTHSKPHRWYGSLQGTSMNCCGFLTSAQSDNHCHMHPSDVRLMSIKSLYMISFYQAFPRAEVWCL